MDPETVAALKRSLRRQFARNVAERQMLEAIEALELDQLLARAWCETLAETLQRIITGTHKLSQAMTYGEIGELAANKLAEYRAGHPAP